MFQKHKVISYSSSYVSDISMVILGVALLYGCSQIAIPIQPVPITLQTVGVIFIILTYDTQKAIQTIGAYILLGALGAPMFSGYRGGLSVILGPSGGYILGFILAAFAVRPFRNLFDAYSSIFKAFVISTIITLIIIMSGVFWLGMQVGFSEALAVGFIPFVIPGLIKSGILSMILRSIGYFKG